LDIKLAIYLPLEGYVEKALNESRSRAVTALKTDSALREALNEKLQTRRKAKVPRKMQNSSSKKSAKTT
jgi:hypothetical protein